MSRMFTSTSSRGAHRAAGTPRNRFAPRNRFVRGVALLVAMLVATLGLPTLVMGTSASAATRVVPSVNPDLNPSCGLDVVLVLDASGSIGTAGATAAVKSAANTFLTAFQDTNTRVAIVKFNTTASISVPMTTVTAASNTGAGVHAAAISSYTSTGRTNWEDALIKAKSAFTGASPARTVPKLIVFVTDGAPNTINNGAGTSNVTESSAAAVDPAVTQMNAIKALGAHSLVVGAGDAFKDTSPANARIDALYRVSEFPTPKIYPDTAFDAATTDLILQPDFTALENDLRNVANQICDGILTVTKYASSADAPNTYVNAGAGWDFPVSVSPSGGWIKPSVSSGSTLTGTTDATGTALFQWNPGTPNWSKTATVTDTGKANYTADHVTCSVNNGPDNAVTLAGKDFPVTVGAGKQVACKVYNKFTGKPNTDVGITKSVSATSVTVGDTVTWTLTATNYGPNTATNVKFTDTLPAGLGTPSAVTASAGSYAAGVWTIPSLATGAGNAATLTFKTTVDTTGAHLNTVDLTSLDQNDTSAANNHAEASVTGNKADVTITKSANVSTQVVNGNVVWTVKVTNSGAAAATNVKVQDTLPPGLSYVSSTTTQGSYASGSGLWTVGTLAASGGTATLTVTTKGTTTGLKTNKVDATTDTPETSTANNHAEASVTFTIADLSVTKSVDKHSVVLGDTVVWTVSVTNNGDADAADVVVNDTVPAGLAVVGTVPVGALVGNTWTVGTLNAGQTKTLTITTTVNTLDPVTNEACAVTSTPESTTGNNCGRDTVTATAADVTVTKVPDLTQVYINGTVVWTIKVLNTGKADAKGVVVSDTAPAGLTLGAGTPSQGTYVAATGVWTVGTVNGTASSPPTGGSATMTVSSTVGNTLGVLTNKVDVTTTTPETNVNNNHGEGSTTVVAADVTVLKTADKHAVLLGDTVVWTVKATNNGTAAANGVVVTDVIPAGLSVVGTVPVGALVGNTWNVGTLAAGGGNATLTITTTTTLTGTILNAASITTTTPETNPNNNQSSDSVVVTAANLATTKTADNHDPVLDGTVVWTVKVTNTGSADAQDVVVNDLLPAGISYVSSVPSQGSYSSATGVWTVGVVTKNGGSATLTITTKATGTGSIKNTACSTSSTVDTSKGNDCGDDTVTVRAPKVSVTKVAQAHDAGYQGPVSWTVTATNSGDADALGVVVTDTVTAGGLTIDSSVPSQGTFDKNTGIWTVGTLLKGTSATLTLTTTVTTVGKVTNQACITTSSPQAPVAQVAPVPVCDHDTVTVHAPKLSITKTANKEGVNYGDAVAWTIVASNTGDADATNVVATDTVPAGLVVDSYTAAAGTTFDPATGVWTIGTLAKGTDVTLTVYTTAKQLGDLTNKVCVTTATAQVDTTPKCGQDTVTVTAPNLTITKTADTEGALLGGTVKWTITVTNTGDGAASGVVVTDTKPAGLTVTGSNPSQGAYVDGTGVWTVGDLAAKGGTATLELTSTVDAVGALKNTACVTTTTTQVQTGPRCGDDTVTVTAADVTVTKSASAPTVVLGNQVTWTVTATNNGTADAVNVKVTDVIPAGLTVVSTVPAGVLAGDTWNVGTLNAGGGFKTLEITTTTTATGPITNSVHVSTDTPETNYKNNDGEDTITVTAPDLTVTKTAQEHQQYLGGPVTWTIEVKNVGDAGAAGVVVTDTNPTGGLTVTSGTPSTGTFDKATGIWTVGDLGVGQSATLTLVTGTTQTGDVTNKACATTTTQEPNVENNCDDDTTVVTRDVKLSVVKTQDATTPNPRPVGSQVKYDLAVTNSGKSSANDVNVSDVLPAGLDFVSAVGTDWTCGHVGQTVSCTYDVDLAAGATAPVITITTTVSAALLRSEPVVNTACITPGDVQQVPDFVRKAAVVAETGQCSSVTTEFPTGTLSIVKSNNPTSATEVAFGDTITYNLAVTATGNLDEHAVVVSDDIPGFGSNASSTPTTYVDGSATCLAPPTPTPANCGLTTTTSGGKVSKVTWALGDLAAGQTRTVTFQVKIDVAPTNPEGNGDTVVVTNAGSVKATETPDTPSNTTENTVRVVTAVGDPVSSCTDDTPYFSFTSDGWFANESVKLHLLDKDGNPVEIRTLTADATGHIDGHELWPGFSVDATTGVKTYPGLNVRPLKFFLSGSPQTPTVTVAYPPASAKCDAPLTITKTNEPTGTVKIGDTITYTLAVTAPANGSYDQDGVVVNDYVPGYDPAQTTSGTTTYVGGSAKCTGTILPVVGTCDVTLTKNADGKVVKITWALGSMAPGQTTNAVFKVTTDDQPGADGDSVNIDNVGTVASNYWPTTTSNKVTNVLDLTEVLGTKTPGTTDNGDTLPHTGADLVRELGIALSLLVAGAFLLRGTRRRQAEQG